MKISIKYHDINIRMENTGIARFSSSFDIYTQDELSKCLRHILDQHKLYGNRTLYLDNLYIEGSHNSQNHIIQRQFNEVIQLLIEVKECSRICAYKVNNIILNVKFNDSKDRSSTKLVKKFIQVYNTLQSIRISEDTVIVLSEIQELLADKDRSVCYWKKQIIYSAKRDMNPNTTLPLNSEDVNSSSEASQCNDELTEEDLKMTKYIRVEDGLVKEVDEPLDLTLPRYNNNNYDAI